MPVGDGNLQRVRGNVEKMLSLDAPEWEIDKYLTEEEGVSIEQFRNYNLSLKQQSQQPDAQPMQPQQPQIQEPIKPKIEFETEPTKLTEAFSKLEETRLKPRKPTKEEIEKLEKQLFTPKGTLQIEMEGARAFGKILGEDIKAIKPSFKAGLAVVKRGDVASKGLLGFESAEETLKKVNEIDKDIPEIKGKGLISATAELLPFVGQSLGAGAIGGLAGLIGGPGGAVALSRAGAFGSAFAVEGGNTYADLLKQDIDPKVARPIGIAVGAVNGTLEIAQLSILTRLPGGKSLFRKKLVNKLLSDKKAMGAITRFAKDLGSEVGIEALQESSSQIGDIIGNVIDAISKDKEYEGPGIREAFRNIANVTVQSLKSFPLLLLGGRAIGAGVGSITGETIAPEEITLPIGEELKDAKEAKKEVTEAVQKEGVVAEKPKVQEVRLRDIKKDGLETEQRKVEQVGKETIKTEDIKAKEVEQETIPKESIDRSEVKSPVVANIDKAGVIATKEQSKQELELVDPKVTKSQEIASKRVSEILVTKPKTKEAYDFTFDEFTNELAKPESKLNPIYSQIKNEVSVKDLHKSMVKEALSKGIPVKENIVRKYDDIAIQYGYRNKNERVEQIRVKLDKQRGEYLIKSETFKNSINSKFNFTKEELRKNLSEYMKSALPLSNRGKFVSKILKVKSKRSANKIFNDIQKEHNEIYRKKLVQAIKINSKFALLKRPKVKDNFKNTRDITVDYREKVRNLLNTISFTALSERKAKNLKETIKYKRQAVSLGKEINIPERVINQLVRLTQTPIKKFNIPELEAILSQIDLLNRIGNRKFTLLKDRYNAEKELIKEDLIKNAVKIDKKALKVQGNQIKKLTPLDRLSNLKNKTINFFGTTYNALMPVDYFFNDIMDSNANFDGSHYINIKKPIDLLVNEHYQFSDKIINRVRDLISKSKLKDENFRRIGVYAFKMQENGMEYLKFIGMSEDTIKSVKLNSKEMFIYKEMRKELDKIYPLLQRELRISHNRELGFIQNYFPVFKAFFNADVIKSEKGEILTSESMGNELEKYYNAKKNVFQGFALTREGGKIGANINALNAFEKYITNASYFIHLGRKVKILGEIINSKEYGSAVGTFGQDMMKTYIDLIARRGGKTQQDTAVESALRTLRRNFVSYNIGIKLSTAAVQVTAAIDGMAKIGYKYAFLGYKGIAQGDKDINKNTLSGNKLRKWLMDNFPKFRERVGGDPDFARSDLTSQWDKVRTNSLFMTKFTDRLTAAGIVYGAYLKSLKSKGLKLDFNKIDKEAVFEAEREMELSQATNLFTNLPLLLSAGKGLTNSREINKSLLTFQTFNMFRFANLRRIITNDFRKGNIIEGTLKGATYAFAFGAEVGLRYGVRALMIGILATLGIIPKAIKEEEDFIGEAFQQIFTTIPGMSIFTGITRYGNSIMPTIGEVEDAIEDSHKAYLEIIGELNPRGRSNIEKAMFSISRIFGVPISEIEKVRRIQTAGKRKTKKRKSKEKGVEVDII